MNKIASLTLHSSILIKIPRCTLICFCQNSTLYTYSGLYAYSGDQSTMQKITNSSVSFFRSASILISTLFERSNLVFKACNKVRKPATFRFLHTIGAELNACALNGVRFHKVESLKNSQNVQSRFFSTKLIQMNLADLIVLIMNTVLPRLVRRRNIKLMSFLMKKDH